MATESESLPPPPPPEFPSKTKSNVPDELTPWIDYAVEQSKLLDPDFQKFAPPSLLILIKPSIHLMMSNHNFVFTKILHLTKLKGINIAASNPLITAGTAVGLGFLVLKRMLL